MDHVQFIEQLLLKTFWIKKEGSMLGMNKRSVGAYYEQIAAQYLQQKGYEILEQNYRCALGEIDLIARHEGYLVFVEVKYRSSTNKGYPQDAVNGAKQKRIYQTAAKYIAVHKLSYSIPYRFDVVSILGKEITLIPNAFGGL